MKCSHSHAGKSLQKGFTFVEVVVVLAIIGVLLPVMFSVLFTVARQQNKIFRLTEAKQQGDYAMAFMKSYIRNYGEGIYQDNLLLVPACEDTVAPDNTFVSQTGSNFFVSKKNVAQQYFQFYPSQFATEVSTGQAYNQIMFNNNGTVLPLTSRTVSITNFDISCFRKTITEEPFVIISFTIFYKTNLATAAPEDQAVLKYRGVVKMR